MPSCQQGGRTDGIDTTARVLELLPCGNWSIPGLTQVRAREGRQEETCPDSLLPLDLPSSSHPLFQESGNPICSCPTTTQRGLRLPLEVVAKRGKRLQGMYPRPTGSRGGFQQENSRIQPECAPHLWLLSRDNCENELESVKSPGGSLQRLTRYPAWAQHGIY